MTQGVCSGTCPYQVVGGAIRVIRRLIARDKAEAAHLQLRLTFFELSPEQIQMIMKGRNCRGDDVGDRIGGTCPFRLTDTD
jgi:hypothetical protein